MKDEKKKKKIQCVFILVALHTQILELTNTWYGQQAIYSSEQHTHNDLILHESIVNLALFQQYLNNLKSLFFRTSIYGSRLPTLQ